MTEALQSCYKYLRIVLFVSFIGGNVWAAPSSDSDSVAATKDLISAANAVDIGAMKAAISRGGDVNALVCYAAQIRYYDQSRAVILSSEDACKRVYEFHPLIWSMEQIYLLSKNASEADIMAAEKLLADNGAKLSECNVENAGYFDGSVSEKNCLVHIFSNPWYYKKQHQLSLERTMQFVKLGYTATETDLLRLNVYEENLRKSSNDSAIEQLYEVTVIKRALSLKDSVDNPLAVARCNVDLDQANSVDALKQYINTNKKNGACDVHLAMAKLSSLQTAEKGQKALQDQELKQLASFRKSIAEGDETSCGLVTDKKKNLVKVQFKSSNIEKWMRISDIFPPNKSCEGSEVENNSYTFKIGQEVCKKINITQRKIVNYTIVGHEPVYAAEKAQALVAAFVEHNAGSKTQVRISGMRINGENISRIDGDVVYENGSVIWDTTSNWSSCD